MEKDNSKNSSGHDIRRKAEEIVKLKRIETGKDLKASEIKKLFFELEVRQVELELQNEELRVAHDSLNKTHEMLEATFNVLSDLLFEIDADGIIYDFRASHLEHLYVPPEKFLGKSMFDILPADVADKVKNAIADTLKNGSHRGTEYALQTPGGFKWFELSVSSAGSGRFFALVRDITKYKRTEEALLESEFWLKESQRISRIGSYVLDIATGLWTSTEMLDDIFGIGPDYIKDVGGWENIVHPDHRQMMIDYFQNDVLTQKKPFDKEYMLLRPSDGLTRWVHGRGKLYFDSGGTPIKMSGTIQDITERKQLENELIKTQKLESMGILAGGIAHDFNNILQVLWGNIQLVKMTSDVDDENYAILTESETACLRARDLTQQLLTFAKGGAPIKKTMPINSLIIESCQLALRGSNVDSVFSIPKNLWMVEIDENQINQAINNIVINAKQAMPDGGKIKISAENVVINSSSESRDVTLGEGDYVKISIEDKGVGIKEEHLTKIFDPFFSTKQTGSGLGLATCYSIFKRHAGHIKVESQAGIGSVFHIYLPASRSSGHRIEQPKTQETQKAKGKILVMDDEKQVNTLFGTILKLLGYDAEFANDGVEAVNIYEKAMASETLFDAVILDLTIPGGMGGKETIKKLLEIDPDVKAIVSSGYSNDPVLAHFSDYGFKGRVAKPFKIDELANVLNKVVGNG